jgi:TRAP-type C4-dicarboxylate transport system permease small subunit
MNGPTTATVFRTRGLGPALNLIAIVFAYLGGAVVCAVGLLSAASIIGRSAIGRPVTGDFELVEIGIAIAGSLFLPYCQATRGHIVVDFFTLKAGLSTTHFLDRFGDLLMSAMLLVVGWRTSVAALDIFRTGETSMLLGFPIWIGYAAIVPGAIITGLIALAQSIGVKVSKPVFHE